MTQNKEKTLTAETLIEILRANEESKHNLDLLEQIYYEQLDGITGAPINKEEIGKLEEESSKAMAAFWDSLSEQSKELYMKFEDAETALTARLHYYSFKQGIKYYRELEKLMDI